MSFEFDVVVLFEVLEGNVDVGVVFAFVEFVVEVFVVDFVEDLVAVGCHLLGLVLEGFVHCFWFRRRVRKVS